MFQRPEAELCRDRKLSCGSNTNSKKQKTKNACSQLFEMGWLMNERLGDDHDHTLTHTLFFLFVCLFVFFICTIMIYIYIYITYADVQVITPVVLP